MKTYYELLGIAASAPPDEVKSAFRREIARYHPDKVQHLGPEFQEIAATRAAELTEAYRILMDAASRAAYDASIQGGAPAGPAAPAAAPAPATAAPPAPAPAEPRPAAPSSPVPEDLRDTRASLSMFVRKAIIGRMREAVDAVSGTTEAQNDGFDAVFTLQPRKGLFQKAEPVVRLSVKLFERVDGEAIHSVWPLVMRSRSGTATPCVLVCGAGLAPSRELAAAIAEQRRKNRQTVAPIVIPVDTRDWEALLPPDTPSGVRKLLERLKLGS